MTAPEPTPASGIFESLVEMGRLNGLSDGVFAFAITLLVLDIRLPEGVELAGLPAALQGLAPKFLIYLLSFIVIGGAWGSHQRMLGQIRHGDGPLVWLNLLSLLFVSLVPASASLLGRFPNAFIAILLFALDAILIQLSALWLWRHASRHGLITPALDPRVIGSIGRRLGLSVLAFAVALPLAFLNPILVYALWAGVFALLFTTDWLSWQQAIQARALAVPLEGARQAAVGLQYGAAQLHLHAGAPPGVLLQGVFGGGVVTRFDRTGELLDVRASLPRRQGFLSLRFPWAWGPANLLDWNIALNGSVPLALIIETDGGQADLALEQVLLTRLDLKTSASSLTVALPAHAGQTRVSIEARSAYLILRVPAGVAARIHAGRSLASVEIDLQRFPLAEEGLDYQSPDYETAANRVDIQADLAASSIRII